MKKIMSLSLLLGVSLFASGVYPSYKASLGIQGGLSESKIKETSILSSSKKETSGGMYFSMEEKFKGSHFYYGVDVDYLYTKSNIANENVKADIISIAPSIGYNFSKNISTRAFLGANYLVLKNDAKDKDIGYFYGASIDYSLGTGVTNGIVYKHAINKLDQLTLETDSYLYRMGIKF